MQYHNYDGSLQEGGKIQGFQMELKTASSWINNFFGDGKQNKMILTFYLWVKVVHKDLQLCQVHLLQ